MGMKPDMSGPMPNPEFDVTENFNASAGDENSKDAQSDVSDSDDSDAGEGETTKTSAVRPKDETPEQRKVRNELIKS